MRVTPDLLPCGQCGVGITPPLCGGVVQCGHCGASQSPYRHELRVLLCLHCAGLLSIELSGAHITCPYCSTVTQFQARNEVQEYVEPEAAHLSEPQRLHRLAEQCRFEPPPGFDDAPLPEAWRDDRVAWQAWQHARATQSEQDLYRLTAQLYRRCMFRDDHCRQRAILESAIEVMTMPLYRQALRCTLARSAARAGDVQAAREWLVHCNPRPLDVYMDSAYRVARAAVESSRGNFGEVMTLLGSAPGQIPMAAALQDLSELFRAHAIDKMGNRPQAVQLLVEALQGFREQTRRGYWAGYYSSLITVFMVNRPAGLCAEIFPMAYFQAFRGALDDYVTWNTAAGSIEMRRPPAGKKLAFLVIGSIMVLIVLIFVLSLWSLF